MANRSASAPVEQIALFARNMKFILDENNGFFNNRTPLTQAQLAKHLDMDPATLTRYLTGQTKSFDEVNYAKTALLILQRICQSDKDIAKLRDLVLIDAFFPDILGTIDLTKVWEKWMPHMYQLAKEFSFDYNSIPEDKGSFEKIWDLYENSPERFRRQLQAVCSAGQFERAMLNEDFQLEINRKWKMLITENARLNIDNECLSNKAQQLTEDNKRLSDENKQLKAASSQMESEVGRHKRDIDSLTDANKRLKVEKDRLSSDAQQMAGENERLKADYDSLSRAAQQKEGEMAKQMEDESARSENEKGKWRKKTWRFRALLIFLSACLAISLFAVWRLYSSDALDPQVTVAIKYYSPIGDRGGFVTGSVTVSQGSPDDYAVTMALMSPENGNIYGPKPTKDTPTVPVTLTDNPRVGNFTCVFSGGNSADSMAEMLYVYVVKNDFVPDEVVARTQREALTSAEIDRSK